MKQCMDAENLHRRLKKIVGQVQAIDRMVDEDIPCEDILAPQTLKNPTTNYQKRYTGSQKGDQMWISTTRPGTAAFFLTRYTHRGIIYIYPLWYEREDDLCKRLWKN